MKRDKIVNFLKNRAREVISGNALHILSSEPLSWAKPSTFQEVIKKEKMLFEKTSRSELLPIDHFA